TQSLQLLHEKEELSFGLDGLSDAPDMQAIVEALKNYATSTDLVLSKEDKEESIQRLENAVKKQVASKYIMNYEIRELFLRYL
ncbi:hypothetical protein, partial [Pseudomonas sp. 2822-17]|uniref:hypothetical protein n=1 Tax=Pseudomonas sp. 2822-17 TaxID=1712678 RepID=UPI000C46CF2E